MSMSLRSTDSDRKLKFGPVFDNGFSPREARRRAFIACGPGWVGFSMPATPDNDEDEAVQANTDANEARILEGDLTVDSHRRNELSLEALTDLGIEFANPASLSDEEGESEDEEGDGYPDEDEYPQDAIGVMRDGKFLTVTMSEQSSPWRALGRAWRRRREDVMETAARNVVVAVGRRAERMANSVEGTVIRHADYGIFVQSGRDVGLVHVDTIRGQGSRAKALAFLHGHTVNTRVRVIPGAFRSAKRRYDLELF